ncbi:MAG: 3-phosphoshikimate 1-carboxyvinyltransferase [Candidatus Hecatellaceae archaeon]
MKAIIRGGSKLSGQIEAPPSKSYTHRAFIAALLSKGESIIRNPLASEDTDATLEACEALGAAVSKGRNEVKILGAERLKAPRAPIDCRESASTLRFLIPIAALAEGETYFTGRPGLLKRPVGPLVEALKGLGVKCTSNGGYPPVRVKGPSLKGGSVSLPGDVSSQFFSGLIFACPLAEGDTSINVVGRLESKPYVDLTLHVVAMHGVEVEVSDGVFNIPGGQTYRACSHRVPGDFSSASFLLAAAALTSEGGVEVSGLNLTFRQPDIEILNLLGEIGAEVKTEEDRVKVSKGQLKAVRFDARDWPDLVPVVAALACHAEGVTEITGAKRLRIKESDRLAALSLELSKLGARVEEKPDGLLIRGGRLKGNVVDPHGDHRIAMACAVAALGAEGETVILNAECVAKSYPGFFHDLAKLGGAVSLVQ